MPDIPLQALHTASTTFLCGLIWCIQLVHYPSFRFVSPDRFVEFERFHTQAITWIVGPAMLLELLTAVVLLGSLGPGWGALNIVSVGAIWVSTALLSVPCHARLAEGFDADCIERLVWTNWPRTVLWSLRALAWLAAAAAAALGS